MDCALTCPAGAGQLELPPKKTIHDWTIGFTFGMYFIMGIVFIVGTIIIVLLAGLAYREERRQEIGKFVRCNGFLTTLETKFLASA